jgi:predicted RNase H-like HicB family nuclease
MLFICVDAKGTIVAQAKTKDECLREARVHLAGCLDKTVFKCYKAFGELIKEPDYKYIEYDR